MTDTTIAIILLVTGIALVALFLGYKRASSRKRMMRMLIREGLDPELVKLSDNQAIMKDIRRRCSRCQSEDICERWLADTADADNHFCPNANVFKELKQA